jgi:hypothetical protein
VPAPRHSCALLSIIALTISPLTAACRGVEGPLLSATSARDGGRDGGTASSRPGVVRAGMSLQYQITGTLDTIVDAQLYVVDLFDTTPKQVAQLHAAGRVVIGYVSIGSFEPWRDDAAQFPQAAVGDALSAYPDESWLDIRDPQVRTLIDARFDRAHASGFDGVFLSTLGGYKTSTGFGFSRDDELAYVRDRAAAARARSLSPGLSGDFELGDSVTGAYDWALSIGCIAQGSCSELGPMQRMGKPVFDLETEGQHDAVCKQAAATGIPTTLKHAAFDAWRETCP